MTFDDPDSMHDLQLYLNAGKDVLHEEWVLAAKAGRHNDSADLRRAWNHIYEALALINEVDQHQDKDKDKD